MPQPHRFVLLEHRWEGVHYDFLLETEGKLRAWRLKEPLRPGTQPAEANFDHRLLYLDYEGPISGDRGEVKRLDRGAYEGALSPARAEVTLLGEIWRGKLLLTAQSDGSWTATWSPG